MRQKAGKTETKPILDLQQAFQAMLPSFVSIYQFIEECHEVMQARGFNNNLINDVGNLISQTDYTLSESMQQQVLEVLRTERPDAVVSRIRNLRRSNLRGGNRPR
jgi:hypothetical protein